VAVAAPETPALDRFLSYRLHLAGKITDRASSDAYAQEFGLPVGEARCLAAVGRFEGVSVVELAARANLHKGPASRAAQALVERGLVSKDASATDGRGVVLSLTPAATRRSSAASAARSAGSWARCWTG
jgi:DNA-binding MarR family transcriptional regulator